MEESLQCWCRLRKNATEQNIWIYVFYRLRLRCMTPRPNRVNIKGIKCPKIQTSLCWERHFRLLVSDCFFFSIYLSSVTKPVNHWHFIFYPITFWDVKVNALSADTWLQEAMSNVGGPNNFSFSYKWLSLTNVLVCKKVRLLPLGGFCFSSE